MLEQSWTWTNRGAEVFDEGCVEDLGGRGVGAVVLGGFGEDVFEGLEAILEEWDACVV